MTVNIGDLTLKELAATLSNVLVTAPLQPQTISSTQTNTPSPFLVGEQYIFRTVTQIDVGRVVKVTGDFVTLENASWIADTGRFNNALLGKGFDDVEPFPHGCALSLGSIVDAAPFPYVLPSEVK